MIKSIGPNILPCGTPDKTGSMVEFAPFKQSLKRSSLWVPCQKLLRDPDR